MHRILRPIHDLAERTFGRQQFCPPPLSESLEGLPRAALQEAGSLAPLADLDQRVREVGEW